MHSAMVFYNVYQHEIKYELVRGQGVPLRQQHEIQSMNCFNTRR